MLRTTISSLVLLLALPPVGMIEKNGASQSAFREHQEVVSVFEFSRQNAIANHGSHLRTLSPISADAISQDHSFVIACNAESFFYNPSAGIFGVPFLQNVYKPFGFSYDSQFFLYLKAEGRFPTFSLYSYKLIEGTEKPIADGPVYNAAWSPTSLKIAFITIESANHFHLWVYDNLSGSTVKIFSGWLNPDFLKWSPDGQAVLYISKTRLTDNYFHDGIFEHSLHEYSLGSGTERITTDAIWAEHYQGEPLYLDRHGLVSGSRYRAAKIRPIHVGDTSVMNFKADGDGIYFTCLLNGRTVVEWYDIASGRYKVVDRGEIYSAIEEGLVIREFTPDGVAYRYLDYKSNSTTEIYTFSGSWKLPYAGRAFLTQGGSGYTEGICDGKVCCLGDQSAACDHTARMAYALDFQQRITSQQGNEHILAVEDGTVADLANDVNCNRADTNCLPGYDNYDQTCQSRDHGGAGNYVVIAHLDQSFSAYAHLRSNTLRVTRNQQVCQGFYLANQGHTGWTEGDYNQCGDHLHFERVSSISPSWGSSRATDFVDVDCTDMKRRGCNAEYSSQNAEVISCRITIATEDFEGQLPSGNWRVFDNDGTTNGEYYWGKDSYRSNSGQWSAYCVRSGRDGRPAPGPYPNNAKSWMKYGPFSLADATDAGVDFSYWLRTVGNGDYLGWFASINGQNFYGRGVTGNSSGWRSRTFDLKDVPTLGNLMGQPQVWIAFIFESDASVTDEGVYLDDITIWKRGPVGPLPSLTWKASAPWSGSFEGERDASGRIWYASIFDESRWANITLPDDNSFPSGADRFYRGTFNISSAAQQLRVSFASDDGIWIYVNGNFLGHWGGDWRQQGCVNNPHGGCAVNTDVSPISIPASYLTVGRNVIAVRVSNGINVSYFDLEFVQ